MGYPRQKTDRPTVWHSAHQPERPCGWCRRPGGWPSSGHTGRCNWATSLPRPHWWLSPEQPGSGGRRRRSRKSTILCHHLVDALETAIREKKWKKQTNKHTNKKRKQTKMKRLNILKGTLKPGIATNTQYCYQHWCIPNYNKGQIDKTHFFQKILCRVLTRLREWRSAWKQVVSKQGCETHLSIEVVGQAAEELALDGVLLCQQGQVVAELVVGGDDGAFAVLVELGAAGTAKDLHDVQDAEIHQGASLGVVDLSSLLQDSMQQAAPVSVWNTRSLMINLIKTCQKIVELSGFDFPSPKYKMKWSKLCFLIIIILIAEGQSARIKKRKR